VELLKTANHGLLNCEDDEVAMVFQSENGCLESDVNHQLEVNKKSPSPAVFVYTLSNIVIGEISIRNKWYGESIFFIDNFDSNKNLLSYSKSLLLSGKAKKIIAAKIEHFDENVFLSCALIDEEGSMPLTDENLKKVLNTK
jgi:hypothetical protein